MLLGDGTVGWREYAPYDAILVSAGGPSVPPALIDQLAEGGRMLVPIGSKEEQVLTLVSRRGGKIETRDVAPVRFVPLYGTQGWEQQ
jgi:protein-L-isoaspartate(D-aspartate) O-methyltransferase